MLVNLTPGQEKRVLELTAEIDAIFNESTQKAA
jgi:hypothetical protein